MVPRPNEGKTDDSATVAFRCSKRLLDELRRLSAAQGWSVSSYIVNSLSDALEMSRIQENVLDQVKELAAEIIVAHESENGSDGKLEEGGFVSLGAYNRPNIPAIPITITRKIRSLADARLNRIRAQKPQRKK